MSRIQEIVVEVTDHGTRSFWSAYDQGRLAHAEGHKLTDNPHGPFYPGYFHANMADWERGWKAEEARTS